MKHDDEEQEEEEEETFHSDINAFNVRSQNTKQRTNK